MAFTAPASSSRIPTRIARAVAAPLSRSEPIYRLIVFDLDGTLVDSFGDLAAAVNAALGHNGLGELPTETIVGFSGNGARLLVARSVEVLAPESPAERIDDVLASFQSYYRNHCLDRTRFYPGVEAAIRELTARGAQMAVLTNKPRGFSDDILAGLGVADSFSAVIGGDDLATRKPDPEGLLQLVAHAACAPSDVVLVGDSIVDIATALSADVDSCGVGWGFSDAETLRTAGATRIVSRPEEIVALAR
ncbi:MAG: phosphoglycolate phosphatase [Candidatus Binatia bacterium]|nr:phosphoglycolate phosphatase [Candidatus Binatia bacterium]